MEVVAGNAALQSACEFARLGWQVVKLHFMLDGGVCSCRKGAKCGTPAKHPNLGNNWQQSATSNEETLERWWEHDPRANVGVMLGPRSGIIDVEFDDEDGRQTAEKFLGECYTPTFRSGRSIHRLFRYDQVFATSTVRKFMGLEFRIGNPLACQSVFPPSMHWTGRRYEWLPGFSHLEVPVEPLPDALAALLLNVDGEPVGNGKSVSRAKLYSQDRIVETLDGRDTTMHSEACGLWRERVMAYGPTAVDDPEHQKRVFQMLAALNRWKCEPPLPDDEIQKKCEGGRRFIAQQTSAEGSAKERSLTALGLEYRGDEWLPGQWFAEVVQSDPPLVRLFAPFLEKKHIELTMDQYDAPKDVHLAVLKETGTVCLADRPGFWPGIWNGYKDANGVVHVGLKAKLLSAARMTAGPIELKRHMSVAEFVFGWLDRAIVVPDGGSPGSPSRPFRDSDGNVWLRFSELYKQAQLERTDFSRLDLSRVLRGVGASEGWYSGKTGKRRKFLRLPAIGMEALESACSGEHRILSANSMYGASREESRKSEKFADSRTE